MEVLHRTGTFRKFEPRHGTTRAATKPFMNFLIYQAETEPADFTPERYAASNGIPWVTEGEMLAEYGATAGLQLQSMTRRSIIWRIMNSDGVHFAATANDISTSVAPYAALRIITLARELEELYQVSLMASGNPKPVTIDATLGGTHYTFTFEPEKAALDLGDGDENEDGVNWLAFTLEALQLRIEKQGRREFEPFLKTIMDQIPDRWTNIE